MGRIRSCGAHKETPYCGNVLSSAIVVFCSRVILNQKSYGPFGTELIVRTSLLEISMVSLSLLSTCTMSIEFQQLYTAIANALCISDRCV